MENLITIADGAAKLGVHPETLRLMLRKRELTGVKVGKSWRVLESDLAAYVAANTIPAKVEARP